MPALFGICHRAQHPGGQGLVWLRINAESQPLLAQAHSCCAESLTVGHRAHRSTWPDGAMSIQRQEGRSVVPELRQGSPRARADRDELIDTAGHAAHNVSALVREQIFG